MDAARGGEDIFRLLVDGIRDYAIIMLDAEGRIASWNEGARLIHGWTAEEVVGKPIAILYSDKDIASGRVQQALAIARAKGRHEEEEPRLREDGSSFIAHVSVTALCSADGSLRGYGEVVRDISDQRAAEARLRELQSELIRVSRLSAMGTMASMLAHELNQPLTAVANYLEACRQMLAAPDANVPVGVGDALDAAVMQAVRAGQIIRRLRDFVARGEVERRAENLDWIIGEASALALVGARDKGVKVVQRLGAGNRLALVDRVQIQQVSLNLIRNAIEAMEGMARRELTITTAPTGDGFIEVSVADTGPGLAPEVAGHLFEPFVTTKNEGMGLGLSICRTIIEAHGGKLWAESSSDGTVFHFTVPSA